MKRVLITGVSGVGKSTLVAELIVRGHKAVDTDVGGWCSPGPDIDPQSLTAEPGWVWHEARIADLLDTEDAETLFLSGCVPNQIRFYPRFDSVVLLSAPPALIAERLRSRTGNDFGKRPGELQRALDDQREVEPLLRAGATLEIDTSQPVDGVIESLLSHVFR